MINFMLINIKIRKNVNYPENYQLLKLAQGEIETLNKLITIKNSNLVVKKNNLSMKKKPGTESFIGESYQIFKEQLL